MISNFVIKEDNQGTIAIARNPVYHSRTKHINIKYHYVRKTILDGYVTLDYCSTEQMIADLITKPLPRDRFETLQNLMELESLPTIIQTDKSSGSVGEH